MFWTLVCARNTLMSEVFKKQNVRYFGWDGDGPVQLQIQRLQHCCPSSQDFPIFCFADPFFESPFLRNLLIVIGERIHNVRQCDGWPGFTLYNPSYCAVVWRSPPQKKSLPVTLPQLGHSWFIV